MEPADWVSEKHAIPDTTANPFTSYLNRILCSDSIIQCCLYHRTGVDSAKSILQSNRLWTTRWDVFRERCPSVSDWGELVVGCYNLASMSGGSLKYWAARLKQLVNQADPDLVKWGPYIACFSTGAERQDSLVQDKPVELEFEVKQPGIFRVVYEGTTGSDDPVGSTFQPRLDELELLLNRFLESNPQPPEGWHVPLMSTLLFLAARIKRAEFSLEQECRFIPSGPKIILEEDPYAHSPVDLANGPLALRGVTLRGTLADDAISALQKAYPSDVPFRVESPGAMSSPLRKRAAGG